MTGNMNGSAATSCCRDGGQMQSWRHTAAVSSHPCENQFWSNW